MSDEVLVLLISLVVTSVALPLLLKVLRRREILDLPNDRSSHTQPTPRGAGAAQLIGLVSAWSAMAWIPFWGVLSAVTFGLLGLLDDLKAQRPIFRLGIQLGLALFAGVVLLGDSASLALTLLSLIGVGLFVVVVVNAANFMDGINGISALHGVVMGLAYWAILHWQGSVWSPIAAALVGVSLAFLPWNWGRSARVFLGDSGSYLLGALVSIFAFAAWGSGADPLVAIAPLVIYLADVLRTLVKRLSEGKPVLVGHREHVYQQLVDGGYSHPRVALIVGGFSTVVIAVALVAHAAAVPPAATAALLLSFAVAYLWLPRILNLRGNA